MTHSNASHSAAVLAAAVFLNRGEVGNANYANEITFSNAAPANVDGFELELGHGA